MRKHSGNRKGQSILEYLVIATLVVMAIFAIKGQMGTALKDLYTNAKDKAVDAADSINTLAIETEGEGGDGGPGPGPGPGDW